MFKIIISIFAVISSFFVGTHIQSTPIETQNQSQSPVQSTQTFGAVNNTKFVGTLPTYLSGSGVTSVQTSVGVQSLTLPQSGYLITMNDFGAVGYATLEPGQRTRQEFISFTGIIQNSNGTAVLTGVQRGLAPISPYTASTTYAFTHGGGTTVIISNSPPFYNNFAVQNNDASITGNYIWASTSLPHVATDTTRAQVSAATTTFATVDYANSLAIAGAPNSTEGVNGIVQLATALQQASSTAIGSTAANLVTQSKYATDTPTIGCAVGYTGIAGAACSVVASLTGKINPNFIATSSSSSYNWAGNTTWTASSTHTATTTFIGNSTSSNALVINTVKYGFPSSNGASSSVLTNDAQGDLLWIPRSGKALATSSTGFPNVTVNGPTTETDVLNLTLPANVLSTNNEIRLRIFGAMIIGAGQTHTMKFYYGGTSCSIPINPPQAVSTPKGYLEFLIIGNGATNSQLIPCSMMLVGDGGASGGAGLATLPTISGSTPTQTSAIDSTIAQPIRVTTTDTSASGSFTIYHYTVEVIN